MIPDLSTTWLGLPLASPLVASSSPLTGDLDGLRRLEDAGIAAVVLPSLFEEQLMIESRQLQQVLAHDDSFAEALSFLPDYGVDSVGPDRYLDFLAEAKAALSIPVIASLNADTTGGWVRYAALLEEAGADAVELNVYALAADPDRSAADVEADQLDLVSDVRRSVSVPLAVKLGPYFSSLGHLARQLVDAGADGLVLFNRFYQPDIDLESLDVQPSIELSRPWELRLPLRWIAILRGRIDCSLGATTGIGDAHAVLKALLVGADVTMMASALLRDGPSLVERVEHDVRQWLVDHEYESVTQLQGSMSLESAPDPAAFERSNYVRTLASYPHGNRPPPEERP